MVRFTLSFVVLDAKTFTTEVTEFHRGTPQRGTSLIFDLAFWRVAHAAAFDQAEEFFGKVGGVVAGALERLRHQQDFGTVLDLVGLQMSAKKRAMHLVNFAIGAQDLAGKFYVAAAEAFANLLQHFLKHFGHFEKLFEIQFG